MAALSCFPLDSRNRISCKNKCSIFAILLFWHVLIGGTSILMIFEILAAYLRLSNSSLFPFLGLYCIFGIILMLYPISGLVADVCCGRFKIIYICLVLILCGASLISISQLFYVGGKDPGSTGNMIVAVLSPLSFVFCLTGFGGFRSNFVQFCLDQLLDASSEETSLFLHWYVWIECISRVLMRLVISASPFCSIVKHTLASPLACLFAILVVICVIVGCLKRKSFHHEKVSSNPYKNVWKVLKFVVKHDKPLGPRSAFTYSDDYMPSRMDFAKRIYGGKFDTEVVEDVKTFLKIILMLFSVTPVFFLEVPVLYLFPLLGLYLDATAYPNSICTYEWMIFQSGNLSTIISVLLIPLYLLAVYPYAKKWIPRILTRLGIGLLLMVAAVISMLTIQAVSNSITSKQGSANDTCFLWTKYNNSASTFSISTQVLVIPNFFYGIGAPIISITIFEFISAQSPHAMKGLILGVFYAFKGLFIILGSVATFPFAHESLWRDQHGIFDCGFYYYLSNSVFGLFGLVVFILAARWYHYRERDDPPYKYQYAEDYYSFNGQQNTRKLLESHNFRRTYGAVIQ